MLSILFFEQISHIFLVLMMLWTSHSLLGYWSYMQPAPQTATSISSFHIDTLWLQQLWENDVLNSELQVQWNRVYVLHHNLVYESTVLAVGGNTALVSYFHKRGYFLDGIRIFQKWYTGIWFVGLCVINDTFSEIFLQIDFYVKTP